MNERIVHVGLEERLGDLEPPDLSSGVLGAGDEARAAALERVARAESATTWSRRRIGSLPWLAAAVAVLGFGVLFGTDWLRSRTEPAPTGPQDPADAIVRPRSRAEFLTLLDDVTSIGFVSLSQPDPAAPFRGGAPQVVLTEPRDVEPILEALRAELRPTDPAGWEWMNSITLRLSSGKALEVALNLYEGTRLGIRGLGDFVIGREAGRLLRVRIDAADWIVRRELGIVRSGAELARSGEDGFPRDLRELTARDLNDDDLRHLARFTELRSVDLTGCRISDAGIAHVLACWRLERFRMRSASFGDAGLARLAGLAHLQDLDLTYAGAGITGVGFGAFGEHGALRRVDLSWSNGLTDDGLAALAAVPGLEVLDLSARSLGRVTEDGLGTLAKAERLRELSLAYLPLDLDVVLPALSALGLSRLDVSDTGVTSAGIAALAGHANLSTLDLGRCERIDGTALRAIASMPNLHTLDLVQCRAVTPTALAELDGHPRLRQLELRSIPLGQAGRFEMPALPTLAVLELSFTGADDRTIASLAKLAALRELSLAGNDAITDDGMRTLSNYVWLQKVDLNVCDGFGEDGAAIVRFMLPDAEIVWPDRFREIR